MAVANTVHHGSYCMADIEGAREFPKVRGPDNDPES